MDIPKKVKIGGHVVPVRIVSYQDIDDRGEYNHYHQIIRIRGENDIPEDVQAETLLHEIFEAIDKMNNLALNHTVLTVLSENLFQVIRDNRLDFRK